MKITIIKKSEEQLEITPPLYFKDTLGTFRNYYAFISDDLCIYVCIGSDSKYVSIRQFPTFAYDLEKHYNTWEQVSEDEFGDVYFEAHQLLSITPTMIEK